MSTKVRLPITTSVLVCCLTFMIIASGAFAQSDRKKTTLKAPKPSATWGCGSMTDPAQLQFDATKVGYIFGGKDSRSNPADYSEDLAIISVDSRIQDKSLNLEAHYESVFPVWVDEGSRVPDLSLKQLKSVLEGREAMSIDPDDVLPPVKIYLHGGENQTKFADSMFERIGVDPVLVRDSARTDVTIVESYNELEKLIANDDCAICIGIRYPKSEDLDALRINGLLPTDEGRRLNKYPLGQDVYVYSTDEGDSSDMVEVFAARADYFSEKLDASIAEE